MLQYGEIAHTIVYDDDDDNDDNDDKATFPFLMSSPDLSLV